MRLFVIAGVEFVCRNGAAGIARLQPHPWLAPVGEFDAGRFERNLDFAQGHRSARDLLGATAFHVAHRVDADAGPIGEPFLLDASKGTGSAKLVAGNESHWLSYLILWLTATSNDG